jgi:tetratricopeptide (TPR) repeat protein
MEKRLSLPRNQCVRFLLRKPRSNPFGQKQGFFGRAPQTLPKKKSFAAVLIPLLFMLALSGCRIRNVYVDVIQGNYYYGRGHYQEAIICYMRALESKKHDEWIQYNLGNAYYSLGEIEAALSVWEEAGRTEDSRLQFYIAYNKGSLYYEMGKYREAYEEFRQALRLEPSAMDAKVNLELALRKMNSGGGESAQGHSAAEPSGEDSARILDYVKRKEGTNWTATEELSPSGMDDW